MLKTSVCGWKGGVPVSNRDQCAPQLMKLHVKSVEFLRVRVPEHLSDLGGGALERSHGGQQERQCLGRGLAHVSSDEAGSVA